MVKLNTKTSLRVATFNVSMEALNYLPHTPDVIPQVTGNELSTALSQNHQQIKNIAEIIQRINPDIILLNEFDRENDSHKALQTFINDYLNIAQHTQKPIHFPYFYQGTVNTGEPTPFTLKTADTTDKSPSDNFGFGYFPGHYGMALLSKYPIETQGVRTFQKFKWKDMPNALKPVNPITNEPWFHQPAWQQMRLSSKSHWDITVLVNGTTLHMLASHPTPPVFDGPEQRNRNRNHDEIRFWNDYICTDHADYIYDDNGHSGGLNCNQAFVILGDQNASNVEGDALNTAIHALLDNPLIVDPKPCSLGGKLHSPENCNAFNHTADWRLRADYVLPSKANLKVIGSGVYWPKRDDPCYRLVKDRTASSDHRLVWVDLELNN